ncbi:hypothetical protein IUY40_08625 [Flavobacterium sp. ALJ2]|nr:hypothetical protein [Flavobacterium sp. ALJ2]
MCFQAEILPFVYNRIPEKIKKNFTGLVLLSPSKETFFEVHVSELLDINNASGFSVPDEINKMSPIHPILFF